MTAEALAKVAVDRPLPVPNAATGPYWEAARAERLVMPRCDDCGRYHFYPCTLCPQCSSANLKWTEVSGAGTVYSFTVIHRAPSPAFAAAPLGRNAGSVSDAGSGLGRGAGAAIILRTWRSSTTTAAS